jgi:hypothetical protein
VCSLERQIDLALICTLWHFHLRLIKFAFIFG